jgi:hypothetical protein
MVGTLAGVIDTLLVKWYFSQVSGASLLLTTLVSMTILFLVIYAILMLATFPLFAEVGAMFIGFNAFVSVDLLSPNFSPLGGNIFGCWATVTGLCLLGPVLFWIANLLTFPRSRQQEKPRSITTELGEKGHKTVELVGVGKGNGSVLISSVPQQDSDDSDQEEQSPVPMPAFLHVGASTATNGGEQQ